MELNNNTKNITDSWALYRKESRSQIYEVVFGRHVLNYNRILLLGAGNGNDIDINYFENLFQEIVIADIDENALDNLISKAKHPEKFHKRIIDLSGLEYAFNNFDFSNKKTSQIETFLRKVQIKQDFSVLYDTYDCVINCNYTSQLICPYIMKKMHVNNIEVSSNIINLFNTLTEEMIDNIFRFIYSVLHNDGLFFHSSDMFELWDDQRTKTQSPGFLEIMDAINYDIRNPTPLLKREILSKIIKYQIIGNYIPAKVFHFESMRFAPWQFSNSEEFAKYYICCIHTFKKTPVINLK